MPTTAPDPIVPIPAVTVPHLRGRRVIVGVPGIGFRGDLRADDPVVQGGRTFVPVLTELDFYRAEVERIEVFAPLVPVDRVWVEDPQQDPVMKAPTLDVPSIQWAIPAESSRRLTGCRVIQSVADGFVRDLRALSEVYEGGAGLLSIRICAESEWYTWALTGAAPSSIAVSAATTWVE